MVNSASQALSEFKTQRLGGLLSGYSSQVAAPSIVGTSLSDSATERLARSAPKKSTTAFMDQIRQSGRRLHQTALQGAQMRRSATGGSGGGGGYSLPGQGSQGGPGSGRDHSGGNGTQAYGGRYGLRVAASNAFTKLESAYAKAFGQGFIVNDGYRPLANQRKAYNDYLNGGPIAGKPGTSIHGWGLAADLGGPVLNTGSKQHAWLRQNASQFGWYWVGQRYGEPWHWEYRPEWNR